MTSRLYYTDAETGEFDAVVRACTAVGGAWHIILDRTAFYPTSGGQPFDTGYLGSAVVIDVIDREDGEIAHVVESAIEPGTHVRGTIDAARRRDHMQQHTGQHILSAAFDRLFGVRTVSFHMGAEASTIDLSRELSVAEIERGEAETNRVVWENVPVDVRFASEEEARALPLRKETVRTGTLRLVEIPGFDLSACGGTHVGRTGTVGIVVVTAWERFKGGTRLAFACGERARRAHAALRDIVSASARVLSVGSHQLVESVERMQHESRSAHRVMRELRESLAGLRGAELRASAAAIGLHRALIRAEPVDDASELKALAQSVVSGSGLVAVLIGSGQPAPVVVARSADVVLDAGALVKSLVAKLGGRGGGRPELAQWGVAASPEAIAAAARQELENS